MRVVFIRGQPPHEKFCAREFHEASLARCSLLKHAPPSCTASRSAAHARARLEGS